MNKSQTQSISTRENQKVEYDREKNDPIDETKQVSTTEHKAEPGNQPESKLDRSDETESLPERENEEQETEFENEPCIEIDSAKELVTVNTDIFDNVCNQNHTEIINLSIPEPLPVLDTEEKNNHEEETYQLEKFKKNAMIIFNHENFIVGARRLGTELDVAALERTFEHFRFEITTHKDLRKDDLLKELDKFSKRDFNEYGCICVAILTHGQDHGFLKAYDTRYNERDVIACFDTIVNPNLVAKPIIILIQACRGTTTAVSVPQTASNNVPNMELDADVTGNRYRPTEADMIIFHSSFFGRASVRVVEEGTWFIQTICEEMWMHGSTDHVEKIFRRVRKIVALEKEYKGVKQMPAVTTTLLKKLYLKRVVEEEGIDLDLGRKIGVTRKKRVTISNDGAKRNVMQILFKYFQSCTVALLLSLLVFHKHYYISSFVLVMALLVIELIRYNAYNIYVTLEYNKIEYFTILLLVISTFKRYRYFQNDVLIVFYMFSCSISIGASYVIFLFVTLCIYLQYLERIDWDQLLAD